MVADSQKVTRDSPIEDRIFVVEWAVKMAGGRYPLDVVAGMLPKMTELDITSVYSSIDFRAEMDQRTS